MEFMQLAPALLELSKTTSPTLCNSSWSVQPFRADSAFCKSWTILPSDAWLSVFFAMPTQIKVVEHGLHFPKQYSEKLLQSYGNFKCYTYTYTYRQSFLRDAE